MDEEIEMEAPGEVQPTWLVPASTAQPEKTPEKRRIRRLTFPRYHTLRESFNRNMRRSMGDFLSCSSSVR